MNAIISDGSVALKLQENQRKVKNSELFNILDGFEKIILKGGPDVSDYGNITNSLDGLHDAMYREENGLSVKKIDIDLLKSLKSKYREFFYDVSSMQGLALAKPHGYAGDFEIIERIYGHNVSQRDEFIKWDKFFHTADAVSAVRNRSKIILDYIAAENPKSVFSVGCGSGQDIRKAVYNSPDTTFTLLDNDAKAIERAKCNLHGFDDRVSFVQRNAIRTKFDDYNVSLIWSAGLFDYLNDRVAIALLKRLHAGLANDGKVFIGNFAKGQTSRSYMELVGEWFLIHRTPHEMKNLLEMAGYKNIKVRSDETGVNLFAIGEK